MTFGYWFRIANGLWLMVLNYAGLIGYCYAKLYHIEGKQGSDRWRRIGVLLRFFISAFPSLLQTEGFGW